MQQFKQNRGFSLMETLVAITLLVFGIVGPLTIAQMGLKPFSHIRDRITAEFLAAEGLETVKNIRGSALIQDPNSGLPSFVPCQAATGCYVDATAASPVLIICPGACPNIKYDSSTGNYNYSVGVNTVFIRKIFISSGNLNVSGASGEEATVTVRVDWPSRFGAGSVEFSSYITDWFRF